MEKYILVEENISGALWLGHKFANNFFLLLKWPAFSATFVYWSLLCRETTKIEGPTIFKC